MTASPEVLIVTEQQLAEGYCSFDPRTVRDEPSGAPLDIRRHRFEVIEGPRPDRTYLVRAPGFDGVPAVETEIHRRLAVVALYEERRAMDQDPSVAADARQWISVCDKAIAGIPADRTAVLMRYAVLILDGELECSP